MSRSNITTQSSGDKSNEVTFRIKTTEIFGKMTKLHNEQLRKYNNISLI